MMQTKLLQDLQDDYNVDTIEIGVGAKNVIIRIKRNRLGKMCCFCLMWWAIIALGATAVAGFFIVESARGINVVVQGFVREPNYNITIQNLAETTDHVLATVDYGNSTITQIRSNIDRFAPLWMNSSASLMTTLQEIEAFSMQPIPVATLKIV